MVIANFGNTYLTYAGGTATWQDNVVPRNDKVISTPHGTTTYFVDVSPSVRTQPHPSDPSWNELEALLSKSTISDVNIEEDDAWLDEIRSNWRGNWETLDDESKSN